MQRLIKVLVLPFLSITFMVNWPGLLYGSDEFCGTLRSLISAGSNGFSVFRGTVIEKDSESTIYTGTATFGAVNDCAVYMNLDNNKKTYYYMCSSGKYDSDEQKIKLLWSSMAKLANDCFIKDKTSKWVGRENTKDGKKQATHDFEFHEPKINASVIIHLAEKKRTDSPSLWRTTITIDSGGGR